jgi:hypothetical protein
VLVFEQRHFLPFHNAVNSGITCINFESYLKTMSYAHCRQSFFEKFRRQAPVKSAITKMIKKFRETGLLIDKNRNRLKSLRKLNAQTGIASFSKYITHIKIGPLLS